MVLFSSQTIALFGEAEKGEFEMAYYCRNLQQLVECLGNPPPNTSGLYCAVQALMYHYDLLFFRVKEEGYSYQDYLHGLHVLEKQATIPNVTALCIPGVGDAEIIHLMSNFANIHNSILMITESDLYDFMTS